MNVPGKPSGINEEKTSPNQDSAAFRNVWVPPNRSSESVSMAAYREYAGEHTLL